MRVSTSVVCCGLKCPVNFRYRCPEAGFKLEGGGKSFCNNDLKYLSKEVCPACPVCFDTEVISANQEVLLQMQGKVGFPVILV